MPISLQQRAACLHSRPQTCENRPSTKLCVYFFFFVLAAILQLRISGRPLHPSTAAILITMQIIFCAFEVKDAFTKCSPSASVRTHGQSRAHRLLCVQDKGGRYLSCPTRSLHMHATLQVGGLCKATQEELFLWMATVCRQALPSSSMSWLHA